MSPSTNSATYSPKRDVIIMATATAISLFGDAMMYIVLPLMWQEIGLTALWQIGVLLSVNRIIRLPLNPLVAWLYQYISYKHGFYIAMALATVTTLAYGFSFGFVWLLTARILWGVAWTFLKLGAYLAIPTLASSEDRGYLFGLHKGITRTGALLGTLIGAILLDQIGLMPVMIGFAVASAATFILLPFMSNVRLTIPSKEEKRVEVSYAQLLRMRFIVSLLVSAMALTIVFDGVLKSTLTYLLDGHMTEGLMIGALLIGVATMGSLLQSVRVLWEGFLSPALGKMADRSRSPKTLFAASFLLTGLLLIVLPLPIPLVIFILVVLLIQLLATALEVFNLAIAAEASEQTSRVRMMTSFSVAQDLGAAIGPLAGYIAAEWFGMQALYAGIGALFIICGIYWLRTSDSLAQANIHYVERYVK
ncbi:MFS transporter [Paenalkalicoccus suaedae]|uniref:MFS transporter n=1 Tax=Paenalkalicoccus suaedae TaxID=2592382 RepID=A0A859FI41_9BACI|nr:MFS transporter [Paenalkalicoccus suaedae]QKS72490.1 MFS transporter [Paenalkalicoccus suaedae]